MRQDPLRTREELLGACRGYLGGQRVDRIRSELALKRHGGFVAPENILIVLFASRSGSNYLGQLLSSTGWFSEIGESFRASQLNKIRDRYCLVDHHAAAQWMIDNRGTPNAFGFKAGFTVLTAAAELGFLTEVLDRAQLIMLRRRDRVAQAVSIVKSRLTGRNHSGQPEGLSVTDADYDADAIAFQVAAISEVEGQLMEFADRLGKTAPVFWYEDICANPRGSVADICGLMDLEMPSRYEPQVRVRVLRDDLSARWVQRFRDEHPETARKPPVQARL